ncbi:MAG: class IV adenylate cyclase [Acidobacteriota bacterium]
MPAAVEIEIKLPVSNLRDLLARLVACGATLVRDRIFEDNFILDYPDGRLKASQRMLRLRQSGTRHLLTFKERLDGDQGDYKVRREVETEISCGRAALEIFQRLGLRTAYHYQKYRRTFQAGPLSVTIDELPIGTYMELEGPPDAIDRLAGRLGFLRSDYINQTYRDLHVRILKDQGEESHPVEMIFPPG